MNRRGGWRHAPHDGGDDGDGTEENSFSDCRHRQPQKGEADNSRHGFLCLYQPLIEAANYRLAKRLTPCFLLRVTPSANRNTYSIAIFFLSLPRVEVLRPSTLGCEIATPTELPEESPILAFPKGKEHNVNGFIYEWTFVLS